MAQAVVTKITANRGEIGHDRIPHRTNRSEAPGIRQPPNPGRGGQPVREGELAR